MIDLIKILKLNQIKKCKNCAHLGKTIAGIKRKCAKEMKKYWDGKSDSGNGAEKSELENRFKNSLPEPSSQHRFGFS